MPNRYVICLVNFLNHMLDECSPHVEYKMIAFGNEELDKSLWNISKCNVVPQSMQCYRETVKERDKISKQSINS